MNKIVKHTGEYLSNFFKGKNGTWDIVSTDSVTGGPMECIDTFKNRESGQYLSKERKKIYEWAESGSIFLNAKQSKISISKNKGEAAA